MIAPFCKDSCPSFYSNRHLFNNDRHLYFDDRYLSNKGLFRSLLKNCVKKNSVGLIVGTRFDFSLLNGTGVSVKSRSDFLTLAPIFTPFSSPLYAHTLGLFLKRKGYSTYVSLRAKKRTSLDKYFSYRFTVVIFYRKQVAAFRICTQVNGSGDNGAAAFYLFRIYLFAGQVMYFKCVHH